MYITVQKVKKDLGFHDLEYQDVVIGFITGFVFFLFFCFTPFKLLGIFFLILGTFSLIPITVSQKNRMYKIIGLIILYFLRKKIYIWERDE